MARARRQQKLLKRRKSPSRQNLLNHPQLRSREAYLAEFREAFREAYHEE